MLTPRLCSHGEQYMLLRTPELLHVRNYGSFLPVTPGNDDFHCVHSLGLHEFKTSTTMSFDSSIIMACFVERPQ